MNAIAYEDLTGLDEDELSRRLDEVEQAEQSTRPFSDPCRPWPNEYRPWLFHGSWFGACPRCRDEARDYYGRDVAP